MKLGIGLPNVIPDVPGRVLVDWAIRAESAGFSSLVTTDRVVYPGYDPLLALGAAAAVTSRIRLITDVIVGPVRSPVLLAKDAAGVQEISQGRLVLGVGPGVREDDFVVAERDFAGRWARFERDLGIMRRVWAGEPAEGTDRSPLPRPLPDGGVPVLMGGFSDGCIRRAVKWGIGWAAPSLPPDDVVPFARRVREAWAAAGRDGSPEIIAMARFGIGEDVLEESRHSARDYFSILGPELAEVFANDAARDTEAVQAMIGKYAEAGVDELIFNPTVARVSQVDRLAEACFG
ncbi:monooxygenase [Sphaerisporangium krabiense]|uniref:Alkanesulfonate monooxygenase SsuD/methylene tetrahydromethanopterin reductase-like flavin-dependent oxidoreductase (Luciferase family) n=1 Tax=Sphaerisporangium krabiense TaxID=763782 RepID=A0A7W8Z716_9ACTN|nr:LLM class flavin-dependent oxidoreductase [Sphaerisporangium krabiense]MBB5628425.1 alkanesulfonate monooxygenase SsuD/methylene tetrahydromethanopterin reductase-like flavin-dependent oxidoreductase (luciferase family) [Sphaerisporangium krabiense]GII66836.1 monooxygenase [Sphaerisporangium krabiense]